MAEIVCARCGQVKDRNTGEVNRALRTGAPLYCSRECSFAAKATGRKALGWHERRFEERPNTVRSDCLECGKPMWLPASKVADYKRCGPDCVETGRERQYLALVRSCAACGGDFRPTPLQLRMGHGKYCSRQCIPSEHLSTPEALAYAQHRRRERVAAGAIFWKTGPDHHSWKGGKRAHLDRKRDSGKGAAGLRRYRAANPDKVREFAQRRKGRKLGRLPRGTVARIGDMQRWKCAICRIGVRNKYHLDHIVPLAGGGTHVPRNIQLLCGQCNVRKSAKDPINYMRELGRLL